MQKIPTLYIRDEDNPKFVTREVNPDCQWVIDGEGTATEKWDGSACLVHDGTLYRRHRVKPGKAKPPGWIHWNFEQPEQSGHGWAPVTDSTADQYHREAWDYRGYADGTWELLGPSLQKNPHRLERHLLWRHGGYRYPDAPRTFDALREWFKIMPPMEGLVWHHPDGRMAKIKRRDFNLPWPVRREEQSARERRERLGEG